MHKDVLQVADLKAYSQAERDIFGLCKAHPCRLAGARDFGNTRKERAVLGI